MNLSLKPGQIALGRALGQAGEFCQGISTQTRIFADELQKSAWSSKSDFYWTTSHRTGILLKQPVDTTRQEIGRRRERGARQIIPRIPLKPKTAQTRKAFTDPLTIKPWEFKPLIVKCWRSFRKAFGRTREERMPMVEGWRNAPDFIRFVINEKTEISQMSVIVQDDSVQQEG